MRYLMILEVSQKQAYIFSSTRLRDNIANSRAICQVTDPAYFSAVAADTGVAFREDENVVYSGGGHTVLEFAGERQAKDFAFAVSCAVKREFPEIELFIRTTAYDESASPGENLKSLSEELEAKKSVRAASFHQGSFGVERMEADTRKTSATVSGGKRYAENEEKEYVPEGFQVPKQFENLGNSRDSSSFIAVIHIDGNAMGKRVERIRRQNEDRPWEEYKEALREFSDSVDRDFKEAYAETSDRVAALIRAGKLKELDLRDHAFPMRRIILAGDDVCFVTEGRIGIEAARVYIEQLGKKKNKLDGEGYTACAGVAVVHQKYPFYKAYELAEMLCSNAKRFIAAFSEAGRDAAGAACAVDWHIAFGEVVDTLAEVREQYRTNDGNRLELRPYLLSAAPDILEKEPIRRYANFRRLMRMLQEEKIAYARGKIKEFREALREGETASEYYLKTKLMSDLALVGYQDVFKELDAKNLFSGKGLGRQVFADTGNGRRSLYFDAIELLDTYVALD